MSRDLPEARVRPGERGDTRFLAWVIQAASRSHLERGVWDVALPDDAERLDFLDALAFAEPASFCHHAGFLVAEVDGRAAAALCGYEPKRALPQLDASQGAAMRALGWGDAEAAALAERMRSLGNPFPPIPNDHWVVEWVATLPEFRGRGLAEQLVQQVLERGRALGYARAQISYLIGNDRARRVYERCGFRTVDERRDPDFEAALGSPGIARMQRAL